MNDKGQARVTSQAVEKDRLTKKRWRQVSKLLIKDMDIHKSTIEYWCVEENEDEMDCFSITKGIMIIIFARCQSNYKRRMLEGCCQ